MRLDWYGQKWEQTEMFGRINVGLYLSRRMTGVWSKWTLAMKASTDTECKETKSTSSKTTESVKQLTLW